MWTGTSSRDTVSAATHTSLSDDPEIVVGSDVTCLVDQHTSLSGKWDAVAEDGGVALVSRAEAYSMIGEARLTTSKSFDKCHVMTSDKSNITVETTDDSTFAQFTIRSTVSAQQRLAGQSAVFDCILQETNVNDMHVRSCNDASEEPEALVTSDNSANSDIANSSISDNKPLMYSIMKCPTCGSGIRQPVPHTKSTSPPYPGMISADLLTKVLKQNARLKQTLRDVMSQQGTTPATYLTIRERDDVIIQLRQELNDYRCRYQALRDQVKTLTQTHVIAESFGCHQDSPTTTMLKKL